MAYRNTDSMQYIIDTCMNMGVIQGSTCSRSIPTYYSKASADVWLDASGVAHPTDAALVSAPGTIGLLKFPAAANRNDYPYASSDLETLGQNVTDTNAFMLQLHAATTSWDDATARSSRAPLSPDCARATRQ